MKKFCKILGLLGSLALCTSVTFAAPANSLRVDVPFSFVLSGKLFPAGRYMVEETDSGVILVQGEGNAALALTIPGSPMKTGVSPALRFVAGNGHEYLVGIDNESASRAVSQHASETRALTLAH